MDNPVQTECSTGVKPPPPTELRSSSTENVYSCRERVELLRSSLWRVVLPRAALHLHGVIHVKVLRTTES
jgi:hypothetical protein